MNIDSGFATHIHYEASGNNARQQQTWIGQQAVWILKRGTIECEAVKNERVEQIDGRGI